MVGPHPTDGTKLNGPLMRRKIRRPLVRLHSISGIQISLLPIGGQGVPAKRWWAHCWLSAKLRPLWGRYYTLRGGRRIG